MAPVFHRIGWTVLAFGAQLPLVLVGWAALSRVDDRRIDLVAQATAPALLIAITLAVGLGALRLKVPFISATLTAILLGLAVWPQWFPDRGQADPRSPSLTLYSANLFSGNTEIDSINSSIVAADPDILVLVEVPGQFVTRIDEVLTSYPYRVVRFDRQQGHEGIVVASRYPLRRGSYKPKGVGHVVAFIDTPLGKINVVAARVTRPWPFTPAGRQDGEVAALKALVSSLSGPTVVAGDFNSVSSATIGRQMQDRPNLKAGPGWPGTWPASLPAQLGLSIDQVYRSPDLAVLGRSLGRRTGSDHRPVITRLALANAGTTR